MEKEKNKHAVVLGKLGGLSKSEKKKESSRENGKKGGRPRKGLSTHRAGVTRDNTVN
jgi:hypothetical protein